MLDLRCIELNDRMTDSSVREKLKFYYSLYSRVNGKAPRIIYATPPVGAMYSLPLCSFAIKFNIIIKFLDREPWQKIYFYFGDNDEKTT